MTPTIWMSHSALLEIVTEAGQKSPNETGGVLIGYWAKKWEEAVIAQTIGPGPNAIHSPSSFSPDGEYHWEQIDDVFKATEGRLTYMGDWHSHPLSGAFLSTKDKKTLKKIAKDPASQTPHPLMLVLTRGESWMPYIWKWEPNRWSGLALNWVCQPMRIQLYG